MKNILFVFCALPFLFACETENQKDYATIKNPELPLVIPSLFPAVNPAFNFNKPTKYGVLLGEKLFNEKQLSLNNTISCASCHVQKNAFADTNPIAIGVFNRKGMRNTPAIQNLAFMQFYMWDGNELQLEHQPIVPILTKEEMSGSMQDIITKLQHVEEYISLFEKTYGDPKITQERIFKALAQYQYTLISAKSKYDKMINKELSFTENEKEGQHLFEKKCTPCHSGQLFTDQTFRNIGFPINPNPEEQGRARVTGIDTDLYAFRVPSLRNIQHTAPYGSFGQFSSLKEVLDYLDNGVINAKNLDPILKNNNNRIPLTEIEKTNLIAFLNTLSDESFIKNQK